MIGMTTGQVCGEFDSTRFNILPIQIRRIFYIAKFKHNLLASILRYKLTLTHPNLVYYRVLKNIKGKKKKKN